MNTFHIGQKIIHRTGETAIYLGPCRDRRWMMVRWCYDGTTETREKITAEWSAY